MTGRGGEEEEAAVVGGRYKEAAAAASGSVKATPAAQEARETLTSRRRYTRVGSSLAGSAQCRTVS